MLAKTHGLKEFETTLEESLRSNEDLHVDDIIKEADHYMRGGKTLLPLKPI